MRPRIVLPIVLAALAVTTVTLHRKAGYGRAHEPPTWVQEENRKWEEQVAAATNLETRVALGGGKVLEGFKARYVVFSEDMAEEISQDVAYLNSIVTNMLNDMKGTFGTNQVDISKFEQWYEGQFPQYAPEGLGDTQRLEEVKAYVKGVCYGNCDVVHTEVN